MKYPKFFDIVETIVLKDDLSNFLGTFEDGIVEFTYAEIVKSAGHSCPTIAGAYLMTQKGLKELFGDEIPLRGNIKAEFPEPLQEGVTGVVSNTISSITGATEISGFKGIGGSFVRHSLMKFSSDIESSVRFTRMDTGKTVDVVYNPDLIPGSPKIKELMPRVLTGSASAEERREFGELWQKRVEDIFNHADDVVSVRILPV